MKLSEMINCNVVQKLQKKTGNASVPLVGVIEQPTAPYHAKHVCRSDVVLKR